MSMATAGSEAPSTHDSERSNRLGLDLPKEVQNAPPAPLVRLYIYVYIQL